MLGDGIGDLGCLAVMERVIAPHDALQLGELADHAGREIGLGEMRGALGERGVGAGNERRERPDQRLDALHLVEHAAELRVEDPLAELLDAALQPRLAVLVPEELGVGQTRPQHALVAGDDRRAAIGRQVVGDDEEFRRQRAVARRDRRNISDASASRSSAPRRGRFMKAWSMRADEDDGKLDETRDLVEQAGIVLQRAAARLAPSARGRRRSCDRRAAGSSTT